MFLGGCLFISSGSTTPEGCCAGSTTTKRNLCPWQISLRSFLRLGKKKKNPTVAPGYKSIWMIYYHGDEFAVVTDWIFNYWTNCLPVYAPYFLYFPVQGIDINKRMLPSIWSCFPSWANVCPSEHFTSLKFQTFLRKCVACVRNGYSWLGEISMPNSSFLIHFCLVSSPNLSFCIE